MASRSGLSHLASLVAGVATTVAVLVGLGGLLTVGGVDVGFSVLPPESASADLGLGVTLWGGLAAIVAFAAGGWVAARFGAGDETLGGPRRGLAAGTGTLLVLAVALGLAWAAFGDAADLRSAAFEFGIIDASNAATGRNASTAIATAPQPDGTGATVADRFAEAVAASAWYVVAVLALVLTAAALGGAAGAPIRSASGEPAGAHGSAATRGAS